MNEDMEYARDTLASSVKSVADLLPQHLGEHRCCIEAQFPTGVICTLRSQYYRWPYLSESRKRTVACTIQLCDINSFHLNVWKLRLTAGAMWQWHCSVPVIAVIETLSYEYGVQYRLLKKDSSFKRVIDTLQSKGVITANLRGLLQELRQYRNDIHLYIRTEEVEMYDGRPKRYNDAVRALRRLERRLNQHHRQHFA